MAATQMAPGNEFFSCSLRTPHVLILNGGVLKTLNRSEAMPIFEYICKECEHGFEALVFGDQKAECPKCHSKKLAPQLSVFAVAAKGSSSASPSVGPCGSCGDPRGPGSCSLPDLN